MERSLPSGSNAEWHYCEPWQQKWLAWIELHSVKRHGCMATLSSFLSPCPHVARWERQHWGCESILNRAQFPLSKPLHAVQDKAAEGLGSRRRSVPLQWVMCRLRGDQVMEVMRGWTLIQLWLEGKEIRWAREVVAGWNLSWKDTELCILKIRCGFFFFLFFGEMKAARYS